MFSGSRCYGAFPATLKTPSGLAEALSQSFTIQPVAPRYGGERPVYTDGRDECKMVVGVELLLRERLSAIPVLEQISGLDVWSHLIIY